MFEELSDPPKHVQSVYIQCNITATTICLDLFVIRFIWQEKIQLILSLKCQLLSCQARYKKYQIIKWETRCYNPPPPPLFLSSMSQRSLLCESYQINVMHALITFPKNIGFQDILIHQKSSYSVYPLPFDGHKTIE